MAQERAYRVGNSFGQQVFIFASRHLAFFHLGAQCVTDQPFRQAMAANDLFCQFAPLWQQPDMLFLIDCNEPLVTEGRNKSVRYFNRRVLNHLLDRSRFLFLQGPYRSSTSVICSDVLFSIEYPRRALIKLNVECAQDPAKDGSYQNRKWHNKTGDRQRPLQSLLFNNHEKAGQAGYEQCDHNQADDHLLPVQKTFSRKIVKARRAIIAAQKTQAGKFRLLLSADAISRKAGRQRSLNPFEQAASIHMDSIQHEKSQRPHKEKRNRFLQIPLNAIPRLQRDVLELRDADGGISKINSLGLPRMSLEER